MGRQYKIGDRFLLKIENVVKSNNTTLYQTNMDSCLFASELDKLPAIIDGFEETSYNAGAQDAWEIAGLIGKMPNKGGFGVDELNRVFGTRCMTDIFKMPYEEVKYKIESYEESRRKIVRGDVVKSIYSSYKGIVLKVYPDSSCKVLWEDPDFDTNTSIDKLIKLGSNSGDTLDKLMDCIQ